MTMMVIQQTSAFGLYNHHHHHRRNTNEKYRISKIRCSNDIPGQQQQQQQQHCKRRFQLHWFSIIPSTHPIKTISNKENDSNSWRQMSFSSVSIGFLPQAGSLLVSILIVNIIRSIYYSKSHPNQKRVPQPLLSGDRCPWPFIFFHDPKTGLKDHQTWVVLLWIGLRRLWKTIIIQKLLPL